MNDCDALTAWIQPRHLVPSGMDACRARFENHHPHVLQLTDFLREDMAARLGHFLSREADYRTVYRLHPSSPHRLRSSAWVSEDIWRRVDEDDRFYSLQLLVGPSSRFRLSPNLWTFLKFCQTLATPAFRDFVRAITGFPIGDLDRNEVHKMRIGDVVKPHSDRAKGRRCLAFVLYLAPAWKADYGGAFRIIGQDDKHLEIQARFNSIVVFDLVSHKKHYVADIRPTAGDQARLTLSGWFLSPEQADR
ncbi:MAG: 2OG-Fe(II) oxygenase [Candidatus Thiosymbion ectosymbiont of Robbea hypermnestra]|nr:2OG-Fe(II) oxygenase [Candidatus Thiosymbion ectosymbiont of Robbea hypermnestra]